MNFALADAAAAKQTTVPPGQLRRLRTDAIRLLRSNILNSSIQGARSFTKLNCNRRGPREVSTARGSGWVSSVANWLLTKEPIGIRQLEIGNVMTHPLPRAVLTSSGPLVVEGDALNCITIHLKL